MADKNTSRIYLSPPDLTGRESGLLLQALHSNWITTLGPEVEAFEREVSDYLHVPHSLALSSGTAAIHLALLALGVGQGDTVLCSDLTFAASAFPIKYCGAQPVFIDSDRSTWNMDPTLLEEALADMTRAGRLPKAAVVVDLYGQSADYRAITSICERYNVPIVEDAAEALGAMCEGKPCGSFGEMGILSFNGNKIITTSGGGMLLSKKASYIEHARYQSAQARDAAPYYQHSAIGFNYRMSNLLAAIGRAQLEKLDQKLNRRRAINALYRKLLAAVPGIHFMPEAPYSRSTWWLTCVIVDPAEFGATNEEIRLQLEKFNIESRPVWKPMHMQPVFADCKTYGGSVSESLFAQGLCLPSGSALVDAEVTKISQYVQDLHEHGKRLVA